MTEQHDSPGLTELPPHELSAVAENPWIRTRTGALLNLDHVTRIAPDLAGIDDMPIEWFVCATLTDGGRHSLASPFDTEQAAYDWIDQHLVPWLGTIVDPR
jgi:hypothetical protein